MTERNVNIVEAPNLFAKPDPKLFQSDFEAVIWQKGYNVYHDKMIKCPCYVKNNYNKINALTNEVGKQFHSPSCKNCLGSGYVLIERISTKMVLQSMNLDTKFKEWSEEKLGQIRITAGERDNLSYMDRIIILDAETFYNELIFPKQIQNKLVAFTIYPIKRIDYIYRFISDEEPLQQLLEGVDFSFEENTIIFSDNFKLQKDIKISIKYIHLPQFHVIDLTRDIVNIEIDEDTGDGRQLRVVKFPTSAVGRRSHYVIDIQNHSKNNLIDNSIQRSFE